MSIADENSASPDDTGADEAQGPVVQIAGKPVRLPGQVTRLGVDTPLGLDSGQTLGPFHMAWMCWGALNADKSNAILVCHALTGDQFAAGTHPVTGKPGWWASVIGPGKPVDTDRFFVICPNIIGGCMGSSGPATPDEASGKPPGLDFPVITIADMVRAQALLMDALGIEKLFAVIGGSMGGMQVLEWAALFPHRVGAAAAIATTTRHSAQNIAFHEVGRQAVMADPDWQGGAFHSAGTVPRRGLSVARMAAHITYLSEAALTRKFGRQLQDRDKLGFGFDADFQVESYLRHQGISFVDRFDANAYLFITRAMDYFDMSRGGTVRLADRFAGTPVRFLVTSFTSDWLYPTSESRALVQALNQAGGDVSFVEIDSDKGHDAFLLDEPEFHAVLSGFIEGEAAARGLTAVACDAGKGLETATESDTPRPADMRVDLKLIAGLVPPGAKVLDVGCGDGTLIGALVRDKGVRARGIELDPACVTRAVHRGLSVVQGDAEEEIRGFHDQAFDYVILSQTLQAMRDPRAMLTELARTGRHIIVSFFNFGHWQVRTHLALKGRMPVSPDIPFQWYDTPNIHFCTIADFVALVDETGLAIERSAVTGLTGAAAIRDGPPAPLYNLTGKQAVFLLSSQKG